MLIKQRHLFIAFVVKRALVKDTVERSKVVVVGISGREPRAGDVDIMKLILDCFFKNRGSLADNRILISVQS